MSCSGTGASRQQRAPHPDVTRLWRAGKAPCSNRARQWPEQGFLTLAYWDGIDELEPRAFSARMTRRGRSHGITRPAERRLLRRRVGVLALAIAVPAMATPNVRDAVPGLSADAPVEHLAPIQPLGVSLDPEFAAWAPAAPADDATSLAPMFPVTSSITNAGPAGRAFSMGGSFTDKLRAEECLTMAIYYEAASESTDGQRAVAQVVMNRMHHPSYPNTVCGVVFQGSQRSTGCQFSFTCDGSLARQPQPAAWNRARRVASAALGGFVFTPVGLATHYHRTDILPYWAGSLTTVGTIGLHKFYRWSGVAGTLAAFSSRYGGGEQLPARGNAMFDVPTPIAAETLPGPLAAIPVSTVPAEATPAVLAPVPADVPTIVASSRRSDLFPQSGQINEQYARSGTWLRQP
jgi:spore germination cell wall hydrolase CwlJ-like protein